jgi:23S rRNA A2030 N6-methylase RlmJ
VNERQAREIAELQDKLKETERHARDADTLKKQADQQHQEYMRLTDRYNELEASIKRL